MNAFGLVDSRAASPAIIRMLAQGTRSSRLWPLRDILALEWGHELFRADGRLLPRPHLWAYRTGRTPFRLPGVRGRRGEPGNHKDACTRHEEQPLLAFARHPRA